MPELRLVVLATQDRLAYAARFPDAMAQLLEGRGGAAPAPGPPTAAESLSEPRSTDSRSLIDRANRALNEYRRLTSEGKLGDAGAKLEDLKNILQEMNRSTSLK